MPKTRTPPARVPRHRIVADALRRDIQKGKYALGSLLPTEQDLDEMFATSRQTTRTALQALAQEGFIVRRPRVGSTVVATRPSSVLAQQVESVDELLAYPPDSYRKPVDSAFVQVDPDTAATLRCEAGSNWFRLSMLRYAGDSSVPIGWSDIYILPPYAGVVRHPQHLRMPVCVQITEMFGESLERASVEVFSGHLPRHMAGALQAEAESPALFVIRRYKGVDGKPFEISVSVHPQKRFRVTFELQREMRVLKRIPR